MRKNEVNWNIATIFCVAHLLTAYALYSVEFEFHLLLLSAVVTMFRWLGFSCAAHRYFSHRICRTSRWFQFVLGIWAVLTMARGPIKFASGHRHHHLYSDKPRDLHSPSRHGFFGSYIGWVVSKQYDEDKLGHVDDLKRYPELVWLNRLYFLPNAAFLYGIYYVGGMGALVYGGMLSVILTWHLAFSATVTFHVIGRPAYATGDFSKNSLLLGVLLCGEGWHNNHHANPRSARLGHEWWQLDLGYCVFLALEQVGLIWSLNKSTGPAHRGIQRVSQIGSGRSNIEESRVTVEAWG